MIRFEAVELGESPKVGDMIELSRLMAGTLVTDSQDIQATLDYIGVSGDYGCLIVYASSGEYIAVYGLESSIPYVHLKAERLF